jgi:hypothetical protein
MIWSPCRKRLGSSSFAVRWLKLVAVNTLALLAWQIGGRVFFRKVLFSGCSPAIRVSGRRDSDRGQTAVSLILAPASAHVKRRFRGLVPMREDY